jgi:hypothetical protein
MLKQHSASKPSSMQQVGKVRGGSPVISNAQSARQSWPQSSHSSRPEDRLPAYDFEEDTCILSKKIAAIQTTFNSVNASYKIDAIQTTVYPPEARHLGLVVQLPSRVKLTLLGKGFNGRTVKVRCCEAAYFVFLEDLDKDTQEAWTVILL